MLKTKRDLCNIDSPYSSMRWVMVTCVEWGIILAAISLIGYLVLTFMGKEVDSGFLTGAAAIIGLIIGLPSASKAAQSFAEVKADDNPFSHKDKHSPEDDVEVPSGK